MAEKRIFSEECWDALERMKYDSLGRPLGFSSRQWIHLQDALTQGSVSPMECYDAIKLGYCPEYLKVRKSRYMHLV